MTHIIHKFILASLLMANPAHALFTTPTRIRCYDGKVKVRAVLVNSTASYSESPTFDEIEPSDRRRNVKEPLFYVEYSKHRVMTAVRDTKGKYENAEFWREEGCGPAAVTSYSNSDGNGFLVACYDANKLVLISKSGQTIKSYVLPQLADGSTDPLAMSPNDFAKDDHGGVYFTSSGEFKVGAPAVGRAFYLNRNGTILQVPGASNIAYANGLVLVPGSVLVAATMKNQILKYPQMSEGTSTTAAASLYADLGAESLFPQTGRAALEKPSPFLGPDGMRMIDGVLWIAQYAGSRYLKMDPTSGTRIGEIELKTDKVGVLNPTNIWVRGDEIYFTAIHDDSEETCSPVYPSIVAKITDPLAKVRRNLKCTVE